MWSPTHVQVTVQRAKGLLLKGKNNANDCFVTIALGKEKFQTSVKEKCPSNAEWREECDLPIPSRGNTAEVTLTAYNRNLVADQFLGQISIPLADFDVYETPRNKWYSLQNKPGKDNAKARGEIEVKIGFVVKEEQELSKKEKHKSSLGQLSHKAQSLGGSLLSIGSADKRKGIKKFAKNLGSKINLNKKDKDKKADDVSLRGSSSSVNVGGQHPRQPAQVAGEADPGVISEDEDEFAFDDLSHKSSGSSLNVGGTLPRHDRFRPSPANASLENLGGGELLRRSTSSGRIGPVGPEKTPPPKPVRLGLDDITRSPKPPPPSDDPEDEWSRKLQGKAKQQSQTFLEKEKVSGLGNRSVENLSQILSKEKKESPKFFKKFGAKDKTKKALGERIIIGEEGIIDEAKTNPAYDKIPKDALKKLESKTRDELVVQAWSLQNEVDKEKKKVKDLENYLDELLLRVMETTPRILQNPYSEKNGIFIKNK